MHSGHETARRAFLLSTVSALILALCPIRASGSESCDPNEEGFWRNLGCRKEWRARIQRRQRTLEDLRDKNDQLERENADLRARRDAALKLVNFLGDEIARTQALIDKLTQAEISAQDVMAALDTALVEGQFGLDAFSAILGVKLPCWPEAADARRAQGELRKAEPEFRETLDEIGFISELAGDAAEVAAKFIRRISALLTKVGGYLKLAGYALQLIAFVLGLSPARAEESQACA